MTFDEDDEVKYYDSNGNGPPCMFEDEFTHFEKSLDEIKACETGTVKNISKFVGVIVKLQKYPRVTDSINLMIEVSIFQL